MDDLRETFFVECEDLLTEISDGLNLLSESPEEKGTVDAVFRGVHSIKGGAGAFGLDQVVEMAHTFETSLDLIRTGEAELDAEKTEVLIAASDCLADTIAAAMENDLIDPARVTEQVEALKSAFNIISEDPDASSAQEFAVQGLAISPLGDLPPLDPPTPGDEIATPIPPIVDTSLENLSSDAGFIEDDDDLEPTDPSSKSVMPEDPPKQLVEEPKPSEESPQEPEKTAADDKPRKSATTAPSQSQTPKAILRVDAERIDRLIDTVSELIINQSTISERLRVSAASSDQTLMLALKEYAALTSELQDRVLAIRAQPVKPLFQGMARVAREAAQSAGKKVKFTTVGEDTEIDKSLVERLSDPLTHMIRNSIDHGLESKDRRAETDKNPVGAVSLSASHEAGRVVIRITDDGAGLNHDKILKTAIKRGLVSQSSDLSLSEIEQLLFRPGFSTADEVSDLSGRGVGMDVVRNTINSLNGTIEIETQPGQGTVFSIILPLTLAIMEGILVQAGGERLILPISSLVETVAPQSSAQYLVDPETKNLLFHGKPVPIVSIASVLGIPENEEKPDTRDVLVVVRLKEERLCALKVDSVHDRRQVVIKSIEDNCGPLLGASAAAVLGDGRVALILDPDAISKAAFRPLGTDPKLDMRLSA